MAFSPQGKTRKITQNKGDKMQVEDYKIEVKCVDDANQAMQDGVAMELIERLGLDGQKKLLNPATGSRSTFKMMMKLEFNVFETLFPNKTNLKEFKSEAIPVKALQAIDEAVQSGVYQRIEIWWSEEMTDPLAVGVIGQSNPQPWNADYIDVKSRHLICRWADALIPFDRLITMARKKFESSRRHELKKIIASYTADFNGLDDEIDSKFEGRK
jgi:hypothetical protein